MFDSERYRYIQINHEIVCSQADYTPVPVLLMQVPLMPDQLHPEP